MAEKKPVGRPSKYSEELVVELCARLANGMSLRRICEDPDMPGLETVRRWLAEPSKESFRLQYARARDEQADYYADEITEIADTEEDPQKARVRIDARKWVASKLKPKRYGDKLDVTSDGKALPTPILRLEDVSGNDSDQTGQAAK